MQVVDAIAKLDARLVEAAETASFTQTAIALGLSKATVSKTIIRLEPGSGPLC